MSRNILNTVTVTLSVVVKELQYMEEGLKCNSWSVRTTTKVMWLSLNSNKNNNNNNTFGMKVTSRKALLCTGGVDVCQCRSFTRRSLSPAGGVSAGTPASGLASIFTGDETRLRKMSESVCVALQSSRSKQEDDPGLLQVSSTGQFFICYCDCLSCSGGISWFPL